MTSYSDVTPDEAVAVLVKVAAAAREKRAAGFLDGLKAWGQKQLGPEGTAQLTGAVGRASTGVSDAYKNVRGGLASDDPGRAALYGGALGAGIGGLGGGLAGLTGERKKSPWSTALSGALAGGAVGAGAAAGASGIRQGWAADAQRISDAEAAAAKAKAQAELAAAHKAKSSLGRIGGILTGETGDPDTPTSSALGTEVGTVFRNLFSHKPPSPNGVTVTDSANPASASAGAQGTAQRAVVGGGVGAALYGARDVSGESSLARKRFETGIETALGRSGNNAVPASSVEPLKRLQLEHKAKGGPGGNMAANWRVFQAKQQLRLDEAWARRVGKRLNPTKPLTFAQVQARGEEARLLPEHELWSGGKVSDLKHVSPLPEDVRQHAQRTRFSIEGAQRTGRAAVPGRGVLGRTGGYVMSTLLGAGANAALPSAKDFWAHAQDAANAPVP